MKPVASGRHLALAFLFACAPANVLADPTPQAAGTAPCTPPFIVQPLRSVMPPMTLYTVDSQGHLVPNPLFAHIWIQPPAPGNGNARPVVDPADSALPTESPGSSESAAPDNAAPGPKFVQHAPALLPLQPVPPAPAPSAQPASEAPPVQLDRGNSGVRF